MTKKLIRAYTLLELLLVFTIIVLMALTILSAVISKIGFGLDGRRKSDLNNLKKAFEEYYADTDCYPASLPACNPGDGLKPYLSKIPCDPKAGADYLYYPEPGKSCPSWFWLFSHLENLNDKQSLEIGCDEGCGPTPQLAIYEYYQSSANANHPFTGNPNDPSPPPYSCNTGFYGCNASGVCKQICFYDGLPECSPNYSSSTCLGLCGNPNNICL